MAAIKYTKILIKAKKSPKTNHVSLMREKGPKYFYRNMMNLIVYRISKCFWKEPFCGMVCYAMLSFAIVWYGKYGTLWDFNAMLWDFYAMLCWAMVYDGKDKHSATVLKFPPSQKSKYFGIAYWIICRIFFYFILGRRI